MRIDWLILMILAAVSFALAAMGVVGRLNLVALGLLFFTIAAIIAGGGH